IYNKDNNKIILACHVDDMLVVRNNKEFIDNLFNNILLKYIKIKPIEYLVYF
ncbi:uncharacterized protein LY79DRAFT_524527, partial [Colletotrichum navitas]